MERLYSSWFFKGKTCKYLHTGHIRVLCHPNCSLLNQDKVIFLILNPLCFILSGLGKGNLHLQTKCLSGNHVIDSWFVNLFGSLH